MVLVTVSIVETGLSAEATNTRGLELDVAARSGEASCLMGAGGTDDTDFAWTGAASVAGVGGVAGAVMEGDATGTGVVSTGTEGGESAFFFCFV